MQQQKIPINIEFIILKKKLGRERERKSDIERREKER